eukprot:PITA_29470
MSFLDGFLGYNQIAVHPEDQEKINCTTPWGTFMYSKMPFGLMNAGATFQRAMDIAFVGEKYNFVLIYLGDIPFFSSSHKDHLQHLKKVFLKCRWFGISINPKKSLFSLEEAKLLGHIVSVEGVKIDPTRFQSTQTLCIPRSKRDIQYFLGKINFKLEVPPGHSPSQSRAIKLRSSKFCINENLLYWKDPSRILLRCLDKGQSMEVTHQFHYSIYGGHHYWKTMAHKILRDRYYWPSLFSDVFSFVKSCDKCQRFARRQQLKSLPLKPIHVNGPFQQWGLDFIGEINPHSSGHHKWILVATDYFPKWIEAIPAKNSNHQVIIKFLNENIFTRFGSPNKLVIDNATTLRVEELVDMCESMGIQLVHSTLYYPQGNGLEKSSNKSLVRIIKKLLEDNKKNWDSKLKFSLRADKVTDKKSIGNSPFKLVYGADVVFPIQLILPVENFLQEEQDEENDIARRMSNLVELHQIKEQLVEELRIHQKKINETFDRKAKRDNFQVGDWVLKWDALKEKKGNHGKFDAL